MEDDVFKIYVEQLGDGAERSLQETLSPDFLDVTEPELAFIKPIKLSGVAYTTNSELILNWSVEAEAVLPCSICNEPAAVPIHIKNEYNCIPLADIKTGIYDYRELLREAILLEVPQFAECHGGHCPLRKEIAKHLKTSTDEKDEDGYRPFADLDWQP